MNARNLTQLARWCGGTARPGHIECHGRYGPIDAYPGDTIIELHRGPETFYAVQSPLLRLL